MKQSLSEEQPNNNNSAPIQVNIDLGISVIFMFDSCFIQQKRKLSDAENASLINLELVNKNDKKLIKLSPNKSILLANYEITNSLGSFKTKINEIINEENGHTTIRLDDDESEINDGSESPTSWNENKDSPSK